MTLSISVLRKSRTFVCSILVFLIANAWSWLRHQFFPPCCDLEVTTGFPFPFHISGGIAGARQFYVFGLLLDIVLALTLSVLAAWVAISIRNLRQNR